MPAVAIRCPECQAKLAFDDPPEAGEAVECPRCGNRFEAGDGDFAPKKRRAPRRETERDPDRPRRKKKPAAMPGEKPKGKAPKKRKVKQKKSNKALLTIMALASLVVAPGVGWVFYKLFFSTGKIGTLMTFVPPDVNLMRGVDVTRMSKYPGFKDQLENQLRGPFKDCIDAITKAAGETDVEGKPPFIDYAMMAKNKRSGAGGTLYMFQTRKLEVFDHKKIFVAGMGGVEQNQDGTPYYRLPANQPGPLANACVYCPLDRVIIVVANEENQMGMLKASIAARANPKETSITAKLGATGHRASRANMWALMRAEGDMANRIKDEIGNPIKNALATLSQKVSASKTFGIYMYFGNAVKFGAAFDLDSPSSADEMVKTMKSGPMGQQDDSEIPRDLSLNFPPARSSNREFVEFLSTLIYNSKAECAFLEAKMSLEKAAMMLGYFNKPDIFQTYIDPVTLNR